MNTKKLAILVVIAAIFITWFAFDLGALFTLENAKAQHAALKDSIAQNFLTASVIYFVVYVTMTAFHCRAQPLQPC